MKKIGNSCILGPILQAVLKNGGLPIGQNGPIKKIYNFLLNKIWIKRGSIL